MTVVLKYIGESGIEKRNVDVDVIPYGVMKEAAKIEKVQKDLERIAAEDPDKDVDQDEIASGYVEKIIEMMALIFSLNGHKKYDAEFIENKVDFTDIMLIFYQCINKTAIDMNSVKKKTMTGKSTTKKD